MSTTKIDILQTDITTLSVDAIINAANQSLLGGGGVDGAIHRAAGPKLLEECRKLGSCETGEAKLTQGYNLPAKYVIHTVGPVWHGGHHREAILLANCYQACYKLANQYKLKSIAFPAISCGVYGYPLKEAAAIALSEAANFVQQPHTLERIVFACFDEETLEAYHCT